MERPTGVSGPLNITLDHKDRTIASLVAFLAIQSGALVQNPAMWIQNLRSRQGQPRGLRGREPRLNSGGPGTTSHQIMSIDSIRSTISCPMMQLGAMVRYCPALKPHLVHL